MRRVVPGRHRWRGLGETVPPRCDAAALGCHDPDHQGLADAGLLRCIAAQQAAEVGTGRRREECRPYGFRRHGAGLVVGGLVVGGVVASSYDETVCTRTNAGTSVTGVRTGANRSVSGVPSAQAPATGGAVGSAASVVTSRST